MKCSRYNNFIIISSTYIITSISYLIIQSMAYVDYDKSVDDPERKKLLKSQAIQSIIICSIVASTSALFIVAIVKRYRYLIIPWLLLGIYIFYASSITMYWWFIHTLRWPSLLLIFLYLSFVLFVFVIQIFIFSYSWFLYKQIYDESSLAKYQMTQTSDPMASKSFI